MCDNDFCVLARKENKVHSCETYPDVRKLDDDMFALKLEYQDTLERKIYYITFNKTQLLNLHSALHHKIEELLS